MNLLQAVADKKTELKDVHKRMDDDRKLVNLDKYTLTDANKTVIPNAISITLNDPAVFAANVESSLGSSSEQVAVESNDRKIDTAEIEEFIRASFLTADYRLNRSGRWSFNPYIDQQMCRRGRGFARVLFRIGEDGVLITDIVYWDSRYTYYAVGPDGIAWAGYETARAKDMIEAEYPGTKVSGKQGVILDIWDKEVNEVYLAGTKIFDQANPYGEVPVCHQIVSLGSMLADKDSLKYQGESIFFLIRDLQPELNRLVSVIQSLNLKSIDNALQYASKAGSTATAPDHDEVTAAGAVTPVDINGGLIPVPYGELKQSAWLLHQMIEARIQQGSLSKFELGAFNQPMSAVALIEIGQGRDQVFLPRLGARGLLKQQIAEMFISQILAMGESSVLLGTKGHQREFKVNKLDGEYSIEYKYFIKSPTLDLSRFSMAASAGDLIPESAKRREILQRENPEKDERMLKWEEAERLSPTIKMYRIIKTLHELAEDGDKDAAIEAGLLEDEMLALSQQTLNGQTSQLPKPEKDQKPQQLIPMFPNNAGAAPQKNPTMPGGSEA